MPKKQSSPKKQAKKPQTKPKNSQPISDLNTIDLQGCKHPLKEIFMQFLAHSDSQDQSISDEITLHFDPESGDKEQLVSNINPIDFTIHETFPILLLQDSTHFASFSITKELYEKFKKEQLDERYFSELASCKIKVNKIRVQLRRVNTKEVFSSYMGLEIRIIITEGSLCSKSMDQDMGIRKNWFMKSLYRDAEVRSLMLHKYH